MPSSPSESEPCTEALPWRACCAALRPCAWTASHPTAICSVSAESERLGESRRVFLRTFLSFQAW
eukprot:6440390-Alexandrium_andersonii.AAC.1